MGTTSTRSAFVECDSNLADSNETNQAWLKGSIGEGPNQMNYSDQSSVRILGIQRKPRKNTSSKWHSTQNTRRGRKKTGKRETKTALRKRGGRRSRTDSKDAILAFKRCYACLQKRICLPSKYDRSAFRSVKMRIECQD